MRAPDQHEHDEDLEAAERVLADICAMEGVDDVEKIANVSTYFWAREIRERAHKKAAEAATAKREKRPPADRQRAIKELRGAGMHVITVVLPDGTTIRGSAANDTPESADEDLLGKL